MSNFTKHQLFSSGDTLSKMSIHTVEGNQAFIFCQFRHSLPKILKWEQGGISLYGQLTGLSPKDSVDAMRTIHHIPHKNNYSGNRHFNAFGNRFQGWDGNTVLPYELIFLRLELTQTPVSTFSRTYDNPRELFLYPNPAQAFIHLRNAAFLESDILNIYNITGRLVYKALIKESGRVDISHLESGIYFIRLESTGETGKFVKK